MEAWSQVLSIALFTAAIRSATPILYPALAGIFSERSGVLNIALEGIMLISAFAAVVGSYYTGNPWIGVLCAIAAGLLTSLIHAFMCINMRADQAIVGTGINILGAGLPSFLLLKLFGSQGISPIVERIPEWRVPILADIPIIGPIIGEQSPLVYISLIMVPVSWYILFKTPFGLRLRSVGENPRAAETVGVSVYAMRYAGVLIGGALAALGGAFLSVSYLAVRQADDGGTRVHRPGGHDLWTLEPLGSIVRLPAVWLCRRAPGRGPGGQRAHCPAIPENVAVHLDHRRVGRSDGAGGAAGLHRQAL